MTASRKELTGKIALITGGASGIGRAICQALAAEGATIVIFDVNKDGMGETIRSLPTGEHRQYFCDVASSARVSESFRDVQETVGVPSIVVCAAGIPKIASFLDTTEEEFDDLYNIHVKGTFLVMQLAAKSIIDKGIKDGRIITFSSIYRRGAGKSAAYSGTKAAIAALTRSAAKEWAHIPIRCFAVAPGIIDTPMLNDVPEEIKQIVCQQNALNRLGKPEEVAELVRFVAVQKSSFMTGATLEIDGCDIGIENFQTLWGKIFGTIKLYVHLK